MTTYEALDDDGRPLTIEGPDGQEIEYTFDSEPGYDELGRASVVTRSGLSAAYTYDAGGRLTQVDYGNGTKIVREYDNADRLTAIEHRDLNDAALLRIEYAWSLDNTVSQRTEIDHTVSPTQTTVVSFTYDQRDRLTGETRVVSPNMIVCDSAYTYDGLGNRLTKTDWAASPVRLTEYYYDADPNNREPGHPTNNNRLMWYTESLDDGQGGWTLARTVHYVYYETGNVSNITIKDEYLGTGDPNDFDVYRDLALYYTSAGKLWRALWDTCELDGQGQVTDHTKLAAREFYYDGLFERYLTRNVDPNTWAPLAEQPWSWTDYVGSQPYGDFSLTPGDSLLEDTRYLSHFGVHARYSIGSDETRYLHGDLVRSTMLTTDGAANVADSLAYTAFGETIGDSAALGTRYQCAGGWGYESGLLTLDGAPSTVPITLEHVGARWYQPGVGRFVQRDPVGIHGGLNAYVYCRANPLTSVDPLGLFSLFGAGVWGAAGALGAGLTLCLFPPAGLTVLTAALFVGGSAVISGTAGGLEPSDVRGIIDVWLHAPAAPGACFVAGTEVATADGSCCIEDLASGSAILSADEPPRQDQAFLHCAETHVTKIWRASTRKLVEVNVGSETITCTYSHPFWVRQRGWTRARDLQPGDLLVNIDGESVAVVELRPEITDQPTDVYNLSVDVPHTYFVGKSRVLVHNKQ